MEIFIGIEIFGSGNFDIRNIPYIRNLPVQKERKMEESIENNTEKTARKPRKQTTHENKTV